MSHPGHARHSEAMPTFVIEARDSLAQTVACYSELCDRHGLADRSDQAHSAYRHIAEWRAGNGDQCEDRDVEPPRPDLSLVHWAALRELRDDLPAVDAPLPRLPAPAHRAPRRRPRALGRHPDRDGTRARLAATHLARIRRGVGTHASQGG